MRLRCKSAAGEDAALRMPPLELEAGPAAAIKGRAPPACDGDEWKAAGGGEGATGAEAAWPVVVVGIVVAALPAAAAAFLALFLWNAKKALRAALACPNCTPCALNAGPLVIHPGRPATTSPPAYRESTSRIEA